MAGDESNQASALGSAFALAPGQRDTNSYLKHVLFAPDAKTADGGDRAISHRRRRLQQMQARLDADAEGEEELRPQAAGTRVSEK